ncbi:MAG: S9 family peptidase [Terracidiphilus sp.]|jgi:dipeptidyl aminopeptidase/acylaminoacyl peptidase
MRLRLLCVSLSAALCLCAPFCSSQSAPASAPAITLDEFLSTTDITDARISPDGSSAVIATESPDWKASIFRHDLWLWTVQAGLRPLTHSGSEESPQWSPDGKWIAFLSDRAPASEATDGDSASDAEKASRLWLIPVAGGEALPLFSEKLDVHSFAWSTDGSAIYYSVTRPLTHEQEEALKAEWKDVIRWREQRRGDVLLKQPVAEALAKALTVASPESAEKDKAPETKPEAKADSKKDEKADSATTLPGGAAIIATSDLSIGQITPSPDGANVAFATEPVHHRIENPADYELFLVPAAGGESRQMTHNEANESGLRWSPDSRWIYFVVGAASGSLEGKYRDVQGRLYRMDLGQGKAERLGASFDGSWDSFTLLPDGRELALGLKGTEQQIYLVDGDKATKLPGLAGTYAGLESAHGSNALIFRHSEINQPTQAYLAADPLHPDHAIALTSFNPIFAQRAQPEWRPYSWKSDDGRTVEGVLIFPPGKKDAKHLRMLTLIHGGPAEADGDRFGADWYDWATLAAANGWLVFRPNYRGSAGYGDQFMLEIEPHLVSKPGRDILAGVDALVRDGYADPDHLAIAGYSYGGYMTNWLITQTTRFKAALTGAGAVEHAANWGNDDETWDDAWYLGGKPWENAALYQSEAALFQFDKVKTPTHLVQGGADVRVSYLEGVTMERALEALGIPHTFLVFPGEGHGLGKNPWHGYIKVRDELKWLEKYAGN